MSKERESSWPWIATIVVELLIVYPLSLGPPAWLARHGLLSEPVVNVVYAPIFNLANSLPWLDKAIFWYLRHWH